MESRRSHDPLYSVHIFRVSYSLRSIPSDLSLPIKPLPVPLYQVSGDLPLSTPSVELDLNPPFSSEVHFIVVSVSEYPTPLSTFLRADRRTRDSERHLSRQHTHPSAFPRSHGHTTGSTFLVSLVLGLSVSKCRVGVECDRSTEAKNSQNQNRLYP